jgi:hypothetical protein
MTLDSTVAATANRGRKGWIAFLLVNLFATFAGLSYIFFPMGTVVQDGNQTTGILDVPRENWGTYVVLSALALIVIAMTGYRRGARWAWYAMLYQFAFLALVAVVEPDTFTPVVFGIICAVVMWRERPRPNERPGLVTT